MPELQGDEGGGDAALLHREVKALIECWLAISLHQACLLCLQHFHVFCQQNLREVHTVRGVRTLGVFYPMDSHTGFNMGRLTGDAKILAKQFFEVFPY